jgi:CHASE2 domain-containing sensor protein
MSEEPSPEPAATSRLAWLAGLPAQAWITLRYVGQKLSSAARRVRHEWRARSAFQRRLLIGLLASVIIEITLHFVHHHLAWLQELEDMAIDGIMNLQQATTSDKPTPPFVILDIDEPTYRAWDEPFHVPRDRLRKLIDYAVQGRAALVIVDVDLSQRGHDPVADQALQDYLANYGAAGKPPLLLVRAFRPPLPGQHTLPTERRSFLEQDGRLAASPLIQWGSTLFELDQGQRLRRWRLWQITCDEQTQQPVVIPSLQLLAVAWLRQPHEDAGKVAGQVHTALQTLAPAQCDGHSSQHHGETLAIAGMQLRAQPKGIAQRILYELPWQLHPGEAYPSLPRPDGISAPLLSVFSALPITDGNKPVASDAITGRVVVIGGSFWESRDLYLTPLGQMPGFLVLVNAIHSLHQHEEIKPPSLYLKLLITVGLIFLSSLLFTGLRSFRAMLLASLVIIVALLPISYYGFKAGVWLDFVIPFGAVALHWMAARFEEYRHARHRAATH